MLPDIEREERRGGARDRTILVEDNIDEVDNKDVEDARDNKDARDDKDSATNMLTVGLKAISFKGSAALGGGVLLDET